MNEPQPHDLLERILAHELSPEDPAVLEAARKDPGFARDLRECLAMQELLDADADEERAVLEAASPASLTLAPRRRLPLFLVAAAFLALLVVPRVLNLTGPDREDSIEDILLGDTPLSELSPAGGGQDFRSFSFAASLPEGTRYELRIWAQDADPDADALIERTLEDTRCTLTEDEEQRLPDAVRWEVRAYDPAGQPLARARVDSASR